MAIAGSVLTENGDTNAGAASTFVTASVTITANRLCLVSICNSGPTTVRTPTLSATGVTFVQVQTHTANTTTDRITLFRAMVTSNQTGAITITFTGTDQTQVSWIVSEITGTDITGTNGSGAIVQSNSNSGGATTYTASLAAFADATNNAAFLCISTNSSDPATVGSGSTALGNQAGGTPSARHRGQIKIGQDLAPGMTGNSHSFGAVSAEIKMASGATEAGITTQPASAVAGFVFGVQPVARLQDSSHNVVAQAGVNIVVSKASGTGTLSGTLTVATDAGGVATFTDLQFDTAGAVTLTFTPTALTPATSGSFTVGAAPTKLAIITQPSGAIVGSPFTTQPVIELQDGTSAPVLLAGQNVVCTINTGTGSLTGTTTKATVLASGRATFTDLKLNAVDAFTLHFACGALTVVNSASFNVTLPATAGADLLGNRLIIITAD